MQSTRAIGLSLNDPQRGHVALHVAREFAALPAGADGIGIAATVDRRVLISRRPSLPRDAALAPIVGPLKGRSAVIQIRHRDDVRPPRESPHNLGPFRSREFACAVTGGPADVDSAAALREQHLADLPDFLRRHITGESEAEAFFFKVLHRLHQSGQLDHPVGPDPDRVVDAIVAVHGDSGFARCVQVIGGQGLVHVALGAKNAVLLFDGLPLDEAEAIDPTLADSSIGRERLRRFRAAITLGFIDGSPDGDLPEGMRLLEQPQRVAVVIDRGLEPRARILD